MATLVDWIIVGLAIVLPLLWWNRNSLPFIGGKPRYPGAAQAAGGAAGGAAAADDGGDDRDFYDKMQRGNKKCAVFYGSQTGTAEEFSIRLAKEAKTRFGISSLVCDPEEYDFDKLDKLSEDQAVIFVVATYGEGDPTDNCEQFWEFINNEEIEFSGGGNTLENLNYVIFGLGNRTYEHYNAVARKLDERLAALGAHRIGERGEGDDDKALEEDYLEWKDPMWEAFSKRLNVEEGGAGDVADYVVTEVPDISDDKVYHGELSPRALLASAQGTTPPPGSYNSKNPYPAPVLATRELFAVDGERNCIHIEFDLTGSGCSYQHGDHVGVWPSNADIEVERMLAVLGLKEKRNVAVDVESLDPALAKIPFPVPATYESVFRHYLDVSAAASRQTVAFLARYAPNEAAREKLNHWGTNKVAYAQDIDAPRMTLSEVLLAAAGDPLKGPFDNITVWSGIPFDRIIGIIPRLQPRYYSISSSAKLHPQAIHVTAVVLKYKSNPSTVHGDAPRWVHGISTNFILNIKNASGKDQTISNGNGHAKYGGLTGGLTTGQGIHLDDLPTYKISGPRDHHLRDNTYSVPIHVRRSTFRLPTSPKVPIIMIGPGTGVAPFRGFVQERIALARRAKEKSGNAAGSLEDWAPMHLFYGCRREDEDFLYRDEWPSYEAELEGKLNMHIAFSRGPDRKPDGSKIYVQDLIWDQREVLAPLILERRAYIYICGDARNMAKAVEGRLMAMLGEARGGTAEVEGAKELKLLKERNRLMTDTWS